MGGGPGFTINRIVNPSKPLELYEYDTDGYLKYSGGNDDTSALAGDPTWTITRYWYNTGAQTLKTQRESGSWNDREELPWREAIDVRKTDYIRHTITADDISNGYIEEAWSAATPDKIIEVNYAYYSVGDGKTYDEGWAGNAGEYDGAKFHKVNFTGLVEGDIITISITYEQAV